MRNRDALLAELGTTTDKVVGLPVRLGWAALETLAGKNPLPAMQQETRSAIGSLFALPFKLAKHAALGTAKTAARGTWSVFKNLPLIPLPRA